MQLHGITRDVLALDVGGETLSEAHLAMPQEPALSSEYPNNSIDIPRLNALLTRLGDSVLPKQPYLISVPSEVPYRHSSRFVNTWHVGTPFAREEEILQYMSFLPHQEEEESLLQVLGGWSDENGNMIEEEPSPQMDYASGRSTPAEVTRRKKITLTDYKSKTKGPQGSIEVPERNDDADDDPEVTNGDVSNAESLLKKQTNEDGNDKPMASDGRTTKDRGAATSPKPPELAPLKRSSESISDIRPTKKRKTPSPDGEQAPKPKTASSLGRSKGVPGLLSPTLPGPAEGQGVPGLLSPTLPPSLAEFLLDASSHAPNGAADQHQRTESVKAILTGAGLDPSPRPATKTGSNADSLAATSRIRSVSQHSARSTHSGTPFPARPSSPVLKSGIKTPVKSASPVRTTPRASPGPRQRHTVALKYGKRLRKRVQDLLKLPARPWKNYPVMTPAIKLQSGIRDARETATEASRSRRPPEDEGREIDIKLQKTTSGPTETSHRPSTPVPSGLHPHSTFSTPKTELKSVAMKFSNSSEDIEVRTPRGDRARVSTPLSVDRTAAKAQSHSPPTSAPSQRDGERSVWRSIGSKHFALGRIIKSEATGLVPPAKPEQSAADSALSVVLLIEALLCFMINLTSVSYANPSADPDWPSILPYHIFVFKASRKFPHLHGVVVQLGAVCRQYIHKYDMDRLAREPLPDEHYTSAPTPGSDGNTKTNEDIEKYRKKYLEFRDQLVLNDRELQKAWLDGSRILSLDVVEQHYPKTWERRAKDTSRRGVEKLHPDKISRDFFLPLDTSSTTFEGTFFTLAFLEEWTRREKIDWKTRIEL